MNLETVFTNIYKNNKWGTSDDPDIKYFSGGGSRAPIVINSYIPMLVEFIKTHDIKKIVDLGCGDFYISKKMLESCDFDNYIGIDIFKDIISENKKYSSDKIEFKHMNIADDELPDGDLCIIKQVLQHLDNNSIVKILPKLNKYKYVIITEHVSQYPSFYNLHHTPGYNIRVNMGSGVFLDKPPFDMYKNKLRLLLDLDAGKYDGHNPSRMKTYLIEN